MNNKKLINSPCRDVGLSYRTDLLPNLYFGPSPKKPPPSSDPFPNLVFFFSFSPRFPSLTNLFF